MYGRRRRGGGGVSDSSSSGGSISNIIIITHHHHCHHQQPSVPASTTSRRHHRHHQSSSSSLITINHHRTIVGRLAHRSSLIAHRSLLIAHCSSLIAHRSSLIASLIAHRVPQHQGSTQLGPPRLSHGWVPHGCNTAGSLMAVTWLPHDSMCNTHPVFAVSPRTHDTAHRTPISMELSTWAHTASTTRGSLRCAIQQMRLSRQHCNNTRYVKCHAALNCENVTWGAFGMFRSPFPIAATAALAGAQSIASLEPEVHVTSDRTDAASAGALGAVHLEAILIVRSCLLLSSSNCDVPPRWRVCLLSCPRIYARA